MNMFCNVTDIKQMMNLAKITASFLRKGDVVLLNGNLGSGKTTFTKFLAKYLGIDEEVSSPTFGIVNVYHSSDIDMWHYDLYRLKSFDEIYELGIEESLRSAVTVIEWPKIIESMLKNSTCFEFNYDNLQRSIVITNKYAEDILNHWAKDE